MLQTLQYGNESWICNAQDTSKMNAVGLDFFKCVGGKTKMDHARNDWMRSECGVRVFGSDIYVRTVLRRFGLTKGMSSNGLA